MLPHDLAVLFARDLARLGQELRAFPTEGALWAVAPGVTNPAGTLALHLEGNLREYIGRQLGELDYTRDRPAEFTKRGIALEEVVRRVDVLRETIPPILETMSADRLAAPYPEAYNGATISTRLFLLHLLAHFNYHLGQVDSLRRFTTGAGAIELATL